MGRDAGSLRTKAGGHHEGDNKRWHPGQKGPGYQRDKHSGSITRGGPQVTNVGRECEREGTERDRHG